jgi:hypothetical protein
MKKSIKLSADGVPSDFHSSLVPLIIEQIGYSIKWVNSSAADLRIIGPFYKMTRPYKLIPKPIRPIFNSTNEYFKSKRFRPDSPILFHTQENIRHNTFPCDFSISFDLGVSDKNHFRLPYWMEMIDWSNEGLRGNTNPRYGRLLSLTKLMQPLGNSYRKRLRKVVMITSHLNEPRKMLYEHLQKYLSVDGFGPYFDQSIRNHHSSPFNKYDILQTYAFNLCPENSLYPGYITEKIPEAFCAGCVPLTWVDPNIGCDFNPHAMINLMPMVHKQFEPLIEILNTPEKLDYLDGQSLIRTKPSIEPLKDFLRQILSQALS